MYEEQVKQEIETNFGANLTPKQLWALVKFAKHVRLRCRNNNAFNNFANRVFPYAKFEQVNKTRKDGTSYPGLRIRVGENVTDNEESEE